MAEDTLRDDLNSALESIGNESGREEEPAVEPVGADSGGHHSDSDNSYSGGDTGGSAPADIPEPHNGGSGDDLPVSGGAPVAANSAGTGLKAPAGWTPQQREQWSKVPPDLQAHITARETEMATNIAGTSESRGTHDRMQKLGQSYAPIMAAEGVSDPVQAAEGLFQTASQLRMGNAQQKAQTIANLINHYGVDVGTLDNALVGKNEPAPQTEMEQMLDQKMQPFNQMMQMLEQAKTTSAEQVKTQAAQAVQEFSHNAEFLGDVRNDMADLIDMAHARGVEMPLQEAYNKAVALNPEITKVLEQRKLMGGNTAIKAKQAAASSLNGRRSGVTAKPAGGGNLRDDLLSAFDSFGRG